MFERFTKDARAVVNGAVERAGQAGDAEVGSGHLLLALLDLLDRPGGRASFALKALGAHDRRDAIVRALAAARRRGGLSRADADALAGLGIDLTEIVSRVEEAHGAGAMASGPGGRGHRDKGRPRITPEVRDALRQSLRLAAGHRDRHIGGEHLLLALLSRPGVPAEVLADHGVTYAAVERVLYGGQGDEADGHRRAG